jgi:hypothetical protein
MNNPYSKILLVFLMVTILVGGLTFPRRTYAWWGVLDFNILDSGTWVTAIETLLQAAWNYIKDNYQKILRDIIAKKIIDYLVNEAVKWVQGGGQPQFVTDWQGFVTRVGQDVAGQVINQLSSISICAPFKTAVIDSAKALAPYGNSSINALSCPYGKISLGDFYNNFNNGGWKAYSAMWQPGGNYYFSTLVAYDYMLSRTNAAVTANTNEALAGQGYLSPKKEISAEGKPTANSGNSLSGANQASKTYVTEKYNITNESVNGITSYNLKDKKTGESYDYVKNNVTGETAINKFDAQGHGVGSVDKSSPLYGELGGQAKTINDLSFANDVTSYTKNLITTPGSTLGKTVADSLTSDYQWSANIQSWVSALVNAALSRLMREGLAAMQSSKEAESSGNADGFYPEEYKALAQNENVQTNQQMTSQVKVFVDAWQYILNDKKRALTASQSIVTILGAMKKQNCQVTDDEVTNAESEVDRFKNDVDDFGTRIADGNKLIDQLNNATTSAENAVAIQAYSAFLAKYNNNENQLMTLNPAPTSSQFNNNDIQNIINKFGITMDVTSTIQQSFTAKETADKEAADKEKALTDAQTRLTGCAGTIISTSTATST